VLGLLGRSSPARAFLTQLGWCFSPYPGGCIAIPAGFASESAVALATAGTGSSSSVVAAPEQSQVAQQYSYSSLLDEDDELDDGGSGGGAGRQQQLVVRSRPAGPSVGPGSGGSSSMPPLLSSFLALSWPASAYCGSWATDPANVYGINSSKRTRKVGEGGTGGGGDEKAAGSGSTSAPAKDDPLEVLSLSEGIEVILSHLSNLCNHVTQKASLTALRAMKAQPHHAHLFAQPLLLFETFKLLSSYSYKLPARRFLFFDLFAQVTFNMHTIAQFDADFNEPNVSSYAKQKAREHAALQQQQQQQRAPITPVAQ